MIQGERDGVRGRNERGKKEVGRHCGWLFFCPLSPWMIEVELRLSRGRGLG
ncbi:hypothetical protein K227x_20510 [Rubripirellula lacrimiformis]|uniref:Uncharacterized protein n=1 Tax=Rubripirellula lacrimiformis TaxID=1930273 RepID=A0A517N949_9BACT|nr:hypothetical protein K227x_20510 [Rubripirellula lacrimiformis]